MEKLCFQCDQANPEGQLFCGKCGAPLLLKDFIARKVAEEVQLSVRDRDMLEKDSAITVFERAWGWVKILGTIWASIFGVILLVLGWKAGDFYIAVDKAKGTVESSAKTSLDEIKNRLSEAVGKIQISSKQATEANDASATNAKQLSSALKTSTEQAKGVLNTEVETVRGEVAVSRTELDDLKRLQPEFDATRAQLGTAMTDLAAAQKLISNREEFIKEVFSQHVTYLFSLNTFNQLNAIVIPPAPGAKDTMVYMLVPSTPIDATLQLQYKVALQPVYSYGHIHNVIIFRWGDPAEMLKQEILTVSFFPDNSDKTKYSALSLKDGKVLADGKPLGVEPAPTTPQH